MITDADDAVSRILPLFPDTASEKTHASSVHGICAAGDLYKRGPDGGDQVPHGAFVVSLDKGSKKDTVPTVLLWKVEPGDPSQPGSVEVDIRGKLTAEDNGLDDRTSNVALSAKATILATAGGARVTLYKVDEPDTWDGVGALERAIVLGGEGTALTFSPAPLGKIALTEDGEKSSCP